MSKLESLLDEVRAYVNDPREGLPEELFLFATEIVPMVNVDLLIRDESGRILLSWRDDDIEGQGWYVPGGIFRLKETFDERIQRTALKEIGCKVQYTPVPLEIVPIIKPAEKVRCHFFTFVMDCRLPGDFIIDNGNKHEKDEGYLKWFSKYPNEMLKVHGFYRKYFRENLEREGV